MVENEVMEDVSISEVTSAEQALGNPLAHLSHFCQSPHPWGAVKASIRGIHRAEDIVFYCWGHVHTPE